jgi:hypothetical protein
LGDAVFLLVLWLEARAVLLFSDVDVASEVLTTLVWGGLHFDLRIGVAVLVVVVTRR